jgi:hypothetical protein
MLSLRRTDLCATEKMPLLSHIDTLIRKRHNTLTHPIHENLNMK